MIAVSKEDYRTLVMAKGKLEMSTGCDLSLGEVVAVAARTILANSAAYKSIEETLRSGRSME